MGKNATAAHFTRWEDKAKTMTMAALAFGIADCVVTGRLMPEDQGFYSDEAATYRKEAVSRFQDDKDRAHFDHLVKGYMEVVKELNA